MKINRLLQTFGLVLLMWAQAFSRDEVPNFNFPQDVTKQAEADLKAALSKGDGTLMVDALIRSSLAKSSISIENMSEIVEQIDNTARRESRADYRALLYHLEARVLAEYSNHFTPIDRRNSVRTIGKATDIKDKYVLWDSYQFRQAIDSLVRLSVRDRDVLLAHPITGYGKLINYNKLGASYLPTLYHFLCYRGADLTSSELDKELCSNLEAASPDNLQATIFARCHSISEGHKGYGKDQLYLDLYKQYFNREESGLPLTHLSGDKYYADFLQYVKQHPRSIYTNDIRNSITYIERKEAQLSYPGHLNSNQSALAHQSQVKVKATVRNVNELTVRVYRLPDAIADNKWNKDFSLSDLTLVQSQNVRFAGTVPFGDTATVTLPALPYGKYIIVPVYKNKGKEVITDKVDKSDVLAIFDLATFSVSEGSVDRKDNYTPINRIMVVDDCTGKPRAGATIASDDWQSTTDKNGYADVPSHLGNATLNYTVSMGDDRYGPVAQFRRHSAFRSGTTSAQVYTDLGIYRPGETVQWAAILYFHSVDTRNVQPDKPLRVTMHDANGKVVDEQLVTTDAFGRVQGSTVIPTGRLLGTYRISVGQPGMSTLSSRTFQVSEYKTPTFFVEFPHDELAFEPGKPITVTGRAATYSGMPVADAQVKLKLSKRSWDWHWWYYRRPGEQVTNVADTIVRTDANGQFQVTFDNDLFFEQRYSRHSCYYNYMTHAQVTDATGESQEATAGFHIGHKRQLSLDRQLIDFNNIKPLRVPVTFNSTDSTQQAVTLAYQLIRSGNDTIRGTMSSDNPVIDLTRVASGQYALKVMVADDPDNSDTGYLTLYRTTDRQSPLPNQALWIPQDGFYVNDQNVAHVTLGTSTGESHIYYVASGRSQLLGEGWIDRSQPGFKEFTFKVPAKTDEVLTLKFMAFHHSQFFEKEISMVVPACQQTLKVTATSFRDKLVPGKSEHWTFTLRDKNGKPQQGAMMLEMYDKALNSLSDNTWSFSPSYFQFRVANIGYLSYPRSRSTNANWRAESLDTKQMNALYPTLDMYGRRLWQGCDNPFDIPLLYGAVAERSMKHSLKEEVAVEKPVLNDESQEPQVNQKKLDQVEMRLSDVKTALWQPMLTSDKDGNLSLEFDAPNFNTTWLVQAITYTTGLASDIFRGEVLTQQPIMVKSTLPRFVRHGDMTRMSANLQNASDHAVATEALIEVFDPRTGQVYASQAFKENVESMATKPLMLSWTVPDTIPYVGFRVRAVGEDFGDGEQVLVPVLTAISPILETQPFFIDADQGEFSMTMPQVPDNARITFEYSDNPVWQCVTALPSIFSDNTHVATSLAHSLYALNVARGIATSQPIIAEAFKYWQENARDSMLVSALERNSDLKIGSLVASPWLRTSENQTLQMQQLANYFDAEKSRAEHDRLVQALSALQMSDGGFTWYYYNGAQSSLWTTGAVLELLGNLRQLGYQPSDDRLDQMLSRALSYYDKEYVAQSKKKENKDAIFSNYAYTRSLFDNVPMSKDANKLYKKTIKQMAKKWEKLDLSLTSKAFYALALERGGKHREAMRLTESLRQFALTKPETGMYWDQYRSERWFTPSQVAATSVILRAMNAVDPRTQELDQIRKWMLLSKRTTNWGGSSLAADAVQSLLSSGSQWIERSHTPVITIDGNELKLDRFDSFVGYIRRDVEAHAGSVFKIERSGNSPSWGSLYWQYTLPMQEVQAASIKEVSISKEFVALDAAGRPSSSGELHVGDKVRIRLIIECNQAMDYVTITDERASCFEPVDQTSGYRYQEGIGYYRETRDSGTNLFIDRLGKGVHVITYDVFATAPGSFASGIATLQSQQAPEMSAHTAGQQLVVNE